MNRYISDIMPYETLVQWLTRDGSKLHDTVLCLVGDQGQYLNRHARLVSASALRSQMTHLRAVRIDIGSQTRGKDSRDPVRRRLAFDLDASDYKPCLPIRGEAEEKSTDTRGAIRVSVWYAVAMSARLLDIFLSEKARADNYADRYKSVIVFSGNRGAHLWLHNTYRDTLNEADITRLCDEEIPQIATAAGATTLYSQCPEDIRKALREYGYNALTCPIIWERQDPWVASHLMPTLEVLAPKSDHLPMNHCSSSYQALLDASGTDLDFWGRAAVVLLAPRLDRNVTTGKDHLLKAPFSVHHKSGLISMPVDLRHTDSPAWDLRNVLVAPGDRDVSERIQRAVTFFESTL